MDNLTVTLYNAIIGIAIGYGIVGLVVAVIGQVCVTPVKESLTVIFFARVTLFLGMMLGWPFFISDFTFKD